jgi:hypothetical protein
MTEVAFESTRKGDAFRRTGLLCLGYCVHTACAAQPRIGSPASLAFIVVSRSLAHVRVSSGSRRSPLHFFSSISAPSGEARFHSWNAGRETWVYSSTCEGRRFGAAGV